MRFYQKVVKRFLDVIISVLALILLIPAFVVISLAILFDSGRPVFFVQKRIGLHGRVFRCYKFRTMIQGTPVTFNPDGSTRVVESDRRLTRVGCILRKYSLDELPQLFNVLRGEMSLVGPRPDLPVHWEMRNNTQRLRYSIKPGITGLAQVSGRNSLTVEEKIHYDLTYVQNFSLWLDLIIILKTFGVVFCGSGVYNSSGQMSKNHSTQS